MKCPEGDQFLEDPEIVASQSRTLVEPLPSALRVEAPDFSQGEQRVSAAEKNGAFVAPTSGPAVWDRPSRVSHESPCRIAGHVASDREPKESRFARGRSSTKVSGFVLTNPELENVSASGLETKGDEEPNRNNREIKIQSNQQETNDIPKPNSHKKPDSDSPGFRPTR